MTRSDLLSLSLSAMLTCFIAGCGASEPSELICDSASAQCADGAPTGYPAGPFGVSTGQTLENLSFVDISGAPLSLEDLRTQGDKTLLLISTTAGWCTACREEAPKLESLYQEFGCDGLEVMVAYFEDQNFQPAQLIHAQQWQMQYGLSHTVVADTPNAFSAYYDTAAAPMNMIVDLCTMEILSIDTGFDESKVRSVIQTNL